MTGTDSGTAMIRAVIALSALIGVIVVSFFVYNFLIKTPCQDIFQQTVLTLGTRLDALKATGEVSIGAERLQNLTERSEMMGMNLKTCCVALHQNKISSEEFLDCKETVRGYETEIGRVADSLAEAEAAKQQDKMEVLNAKLKEIDDILNATAVRAKQFNAQVARYDALAADREQEAASFSLTEIASSEQNTDHLMTAFVSRFNTGFASLNLGSWIELWAEDAEWIGPYGVSQGKAGVRVFVARALTDWEELRYVEKRRLIQGNFIAWEGTFEGVYKRSGKEVKVPMVIVIEFNLAGKIKSNHTYYDTRGFERQL